MGKVPRFKSARARAALAGGVMLFFLASMTGLATWSTYHSHQTNHSLQQRATAAASLAYGRAHFYMGATLLSISVFSEDPSTFISSYGPTAAIVDYDLQGARDALVALNETDSLIALDETTAKIRELFQAIDSFVPSASSMSRDLTLATLFAFGIFAFLTAAGTFTSSRDP